MAGVFVDSGVFVALANEDDRDHAAARELADRIRRGELGKPCTSDFVFDEVVTASLIRTKSPDKAIRAGALILGSEERSFRPLVELVEVGGTAFSRAWEAFRSKKHPRLSFTDHTILAQMNEVGLEYLASFDSGFDGLVKRVS
ncbi:MAG: type II toxin-antitoxin system VapC family toxin [Nitrososphaerota archaeon]|nr:type II toxin-antitoxin system VapC family toxin [Nitrososphaerota archaeon]MDG7012943.1 type II toxin-antitoxin system VapC family toxin [Nitrososphaerota archaeon]